MTNVYPRIETGNAAPANPLRLLDVVREKVRALHYSRRTEEAYVHWIRDFVRFHGKRHPREMGAAEVEAFLSHLANARNVSASTHQQALSALLFLYKRVLDIDLPWLGDLIRPKKPQRLPAVLTREEVNALLAHMEGTPLLMARLLYGTGMRLMECVRLRVKDVEFSRHEIVVRDGKGGKGRMTMLPESLVADLEVQLRRVRSLWEADRNQNAPGVLPCRTPWSESTRTLANSGGGFGCFRPGARVPIPAAASSAAITPSSRTCNGPSNRPLRRPGSSSRPRPTPFAIPLRLTFCNRVTTSARSRNSWGIRT